MRIRSWSYRTQEFRVPWGAGTVAHGPHLENIQANPEAEFLKVVKNFRAGFPPNLKGRIP